VDKLDICLEIADLHEVIMSSDINTGVHFGCDCGCGGDTYTSEQWDKMVKDTEDAEENLLNLLSKITLKIK